MSTCKSLPARATSALVLLSATACIGQVNPPNSTATDPSPAPGRAAGPATADAGEASDNASLQDAGSPSTMQAFSVQPASARTQPSGHLQFNAFVAGNAATKVAWSATGGGSVTSTGFFTAPTATGQYTVTVTWSGQTASASITVANAAGSPPNLQPGVWAPVSPPVSFSNNFGLPEFDIDPGDPRTLYACTDANGLWVTHDGGSTWSLLGATPHVVTAKSTNYIDSPIAVRVDPRDSKHLYATQGVRGTSLGFWVSHDTGQNWTAPQGFLDIAVKTTNDVTVLEVDPSNFDHILLGSHSPWQGLKNGGILESTNGGATWVARQPQASWGAGSLGIHFLYSPDYGIGNDHTWLVATDGNGTWRTTDAGSSWTQVSSTVNIPHGGNQTYYSASGWLYAGATPYPVRSNDNGVTWQPLNSLPFTYWYTVYGDGKTLYTSQSYTGTNGGSPAPFYSSPESDGTMWKPMAGGQTFIDGPFMMRFDAANRIMYASSWDAGLLALKVP